MQAYAYLFLGCGLVSATFADSGVVRSVSGGAKVAVAIFAVLFIGSEGMALLGY